MQIVTVNQGIEIYRQLVDGSGPVRMNSVISHLMQMPQGDKFTVIVTNNGHDITFRTGDLDMEALVRKVNGIISRTPAVKKEAA